MQADLLESHANLEQFTQFHTIINRSPAGFSSLSLSLWGPLPAEAVRLEPGTGESLGIHTLIAMSPGRIAAQVFAGICQTSAPGLQLRKADDDV